MLIFIDEERAYRYWVAHHRAGFVLDGRRVPKLSHLVLHRATCAEIKSATTKRSHWTTGGRLKACSLHSEELQSWVREENETELSCCEKCQPLTEAMTNDADSGHLTKLGRDVLDYVIESAVIHLEWPEGPAYRLTVGDVAACMGKTSGQISAALKQLIDNGLLTVAGRHANTSTFAPQHLVWPTVRAMQTLPGFADDDPQLLQSQLEKMVADVATS